MHIGIDVREACKKRTSGKGQWTRGFVTELVKRDIDMTFYVDALFDGKILAAIISGSPRVRIKRIDKFGLRWHFAVAKDVRTDKAIDAYVSPTSFIVPALLRKQKPVIPVVHDLIAFRGESHDRKAVLIEKLTLARAMRSAAFVCTVSETTKADLLSRYSYLKSDSVIPIFAGSKDVVVNSSPIKDIVLCIATLCPRKNQLALIDAHVSLPEEMRAKHPLVLVGGRGWDDDAIVERAKTTSHVEWKSYLSDEECAALLGRAAVFAYPSLYEGFGLPIIEAMSAGVPVLTSNIGSMKEVSGDAALLVDPSSINSITDGLKRLLVDETTRSLFIEKGKQRIVEFSWKRTINIFMSNLR